MDVSVGLSAGVAVSVSVDVSAGAALGVYVGLSAEVSVVLFAASAVDVSVGLSVVPRLAVEIAVEIAMELAVEITMARAMGLIPQQRPAFSTYMIVGTYLMELLRGMDSVVETCILYLVSNLHTPVVRREERKTSSPPLTTYHIICMFGYVRWPYERIVPKRTILWTNW